MFTIEQIAVAIESARVRASLGKEAMAVTDLMFQLRELNDERRAKISDRRLHRTGWQRRPSPISRPASSSPSMR
jgi:hypothetical protein